MENNVSNQNFFMCWLRLVTNPIIIVLCALISRLHFIEQFFVKLHNIYAFVSQIFFFTLCATLLDEYSPEYVPNDRFLVTALKTILFYSVFTYFIAKTRDIYTSNRPRFQNYSFVEAVCKIVLEWAKAIIVVLCLRDQGIYFKPTPLYAALTASYYIFSEKIYLQIFQETAQFFELEFMDNLEHLYVPLFLNAYLTLVGLLFNIYFSTQHHHRVFAASSFYFVVYLRCKDAYFNCWKLIRLEKSTYDSFRNATAQELENFDDICAVCLNTLSKAKITPCNHYFHPHCLRQCLKNSYLCPICKLKF